MVGAEAWPFLVPAGDADALGAALGRLCADPALRKRAGRQNEARQRALFGRERMLEDSVAAIVDGLEAAPGLRLRRPDGADADDHLVERVVGRELLRLEVGRGEPVEEARRRQHVAVGLDLDVAGAEASSASRSADRPV